MSIQDAISTLRTGIAPGQDLPEELFLFVSTLTPLVNVDLLIKDERNRTLLTWRQDEFYGSGWHVPGGIIRYKEHALERIQKVAGHELGCSVTAQPVPILIMENLSPRRERGHFISMLYRCQLIGTPQASSEAGASPQRGEWRWHDRPPSDLLPAHQAYASLL